MNQKPVFIGNYKNLEIYYNRETKTIETSENKKSINQSLVITCILVANPVIKIMDSLLANIGIETRMILLIIGAMIGVFSAYFVTHQVYRQIKFYPMTMNQNQFEDFYRENQGKLKVVKWMLICSILLLLIEVYLYT